MRHRRRTLRLQGYDYSRAGAYFVTICTRGRNSVFGDVDLEAGEMRLNEYGHIAREVWEALPDRYSGVQMDEFVIMPDHMHGIIVITDVGVIHDGGAIQVGAIHVGAIHESPLHRRQMLLPKIIGYYKMNTAKRVNQIRNMAGLPLWQRSYYERILRDERALHAVRRYIRNNPAAWALDGGRPAA